MSTTLEFRHPAMSNHPDIPTAHVKVFGHAPYPGSNVDGHDDNVPGVLPFSARSASPIRIRFTPDPSAMKKESRVGRITRSATFSFRPLRPGEKPTTPGRVRPPDATLPTLMYASPWLSVTKNDYKDPKNQLDEDAVRRLLGQTFLRLRPVDRLPFGSNSKTETPLSSSRLTSPSKTCSRSEPASRTMSQMSTATKSAMSSEKRVKIIDDNGVDAQTTEEDENRTVQEVNRPSPSPLPKSPRSPSKLVHFPSDNIVNFYSGYLPPELESTIADDLNIRRGKTSSIPARPEPELLPNGKTYKPLIGDRSLYMREPYPTQPKFFQSDIEQLRFEGHDRVRQSNGQTQAHFSGLNKKMTITKPSLNQPKSFRFGPPPRVERKNAPIQPRNPVKQSSVDTFQLQRERTYVLQNLAREMLKK